MPASPLNSTDIQIDLLARAIEGRPNAAELFYKLAETHWRAGDLRGYATFFHRAYLLQPSVRALLPTDEILGRKESAMDMRGRARALIDQGVIYSSVISALAIAEAELGNRQTVKYVMDYDRFLRWKAIDAPAGMTVEAFNRAVADELKLNMIFYDTPKRAIRHAWRNDVLQRAETPALNMLMQVLRQEASEYLKSLPLDAEHPFTVSRPAEFEVGGWGVVSNGASYHEPHVHPRAWATGVYYVVQPEISRAPGSSSGWLHLGPPPELDGSASDDWERRRIEPTPGGLVLMPGYFWHKTEPMGVDQERICVAFEIRPLELALRERFIRLTIVTTATLLLEIRQI